MKEKFDLGRVKVRRRCTAIQLINSKLLAIQRIMRIVSIIKLHHMDYKVS